MRKTGMIVSCLGLLTLIFLISCSPRDPIKVGMIAGLTGRAANIGTAGRDGALLATEEINGGGGINGRKIELLIRDNKQNAEYCREKVRELLDEGVVAMIGPMTSAMGLVVASEINKHKIPTISPTVSTEILANQDDYFFRIIPVSNKAATQAAEYAYSVKGFRKLAVIYDEANGGYTKPWFSQFKSTFEGFSGTEIFGVGYTSKGGFDYLELVTKLAGKNLDCLVILASSLDTALISQQLQKVKMKIPLMASEWSLTDDLIEYGGTAVEGIEIFHSFDRNNQSRPYLDFALKFHKRFGYSADFASAYAYNAMKIIGAGLAKTSQPEKLKNVVLKGSPYRGVQRTIQFNRYGDAERDYTLLKVQDGKIITI